MIEKKIVLIVLLTCVKEYQNNTTCEKDEGINSTILLYKKL